MVTLGVTYLDNSLNTKLTPETVIVKNYLEIILNSLCHYIIYFLKAQQGELDAVIMYNALAEDGFCIRQSHKANMQP